MMNSNCKDCYWVNDSKDRCILGQDEFNESDLECKRHVSSCSLCDSCCPDVIYKGEYYCMDCLLEEINDLEHETTVNYYLDGEYIGNSDDFDTLVDNLIENIDDLERI